MTPLNFQPLVVLGIILIGRTEAFSLPASLSSVDYLDASLHSSSPPQNSIIFPIKSAPIVAGEDEFDNVIDGDSLSSAFAKLVGSSNFLEPASDSSLGGHGLSSCSIPVFGDLAKLTFSPRASTCNKNDDGDDCPTEYILHAFDFDRPLADFGNLCLELYKYRNDIRDVVSIDGLKQNVLDYLNSQPPDPGMDAELNAACRAVGNEKFGMLLDDMIDGESLRKFQRDGFVVIDDVMKTSQSSNEKVGKWTDKSKTAQGHVRTDTVAFLNRNNALECGLEEQYDFLLTLASHLNDNLDLFASPYKPVLPGTRDRPLTNPSRFNVQIAEYGCGDYYNAHSDNSIDTSVRNGAFDGFGTTIESNDEDLSSSSCDDVTLPQRRSNWRCITAILYMNKGWKVSDGGQLRMYLDSASVKHPSTAFETHSYIDINPSNGKLLLFDSRMIHSVEKVDSDSKVRRALTLWITRPEENGVTGENYFLTDD